MIVLARERKPVVRSIRGGPGELICLDSIGFAEGTKITEEGIGNRLHLVSEMTFAPGTGIGPHSHDVNSELMVILKGELVCIDDGVEYTLHKGDVSYCYGGGSHTFINRSDKDAVLLCVGLNPKDKIEA